MTPYYFKTPFALSGDVAEIPREAQPSGAVSFEDGFGPDYSLVNSDPDSKKVPRDKHNWLLEAITENIKQYQEYGTPEWITAADNDGVDFSYSAGARVKYSGAVWVSLVDSNDVEPGTDATKWRLAATVETRGGSFGSIVSVAVTPYTVLAANFGYQHILSGSAAVMTMAAIAGVNIGDSFNFQNNLSTAVTLNRDGSSTFIGQNGINFTTTAITIPPYCACIVTKYDATSWSVVIVGGLSDVYRESIFSETQSAGVNGGTFTDSAWRTRTLNTTQYNGITGASLGSNQITLAAGTYEIDAWAVANQCNNHKARLQNITAGSTLLTGSTERAAAGTSTTSKSVIRGIITLSVTTVLELQHRCQDTKATDGFGIAAGFSVAETYSEVKVRRL